MDVELKDASWELASRRHRGLKLVPLTLAGEVLYHLLPSLATLLLPIRFLHPVIEPLKPPRWFGLALAAPILDRRETTLELLLGYLPQREESNAPVDLALDFHARLVRLQVVTAAEQLVPVSLDFL